MPTGKVSTIYSWNGKPLGQVLKTRGQSFLLSAGRTHFANASSSMAEDGSVDPDALVDWDRKPE